MPATHNAKPLELAARGRRHGPRPVDSAVRGDKPTHQNKLTHLNLTNGRFNGVLREYRENCPDDLLQYKKYSDTGYVHSTP